MQASQGHAKTFVRRLCLVFFCNKNTDSWGSSSTKRRHVILCQLNYSRSVDVGWVGGCVHCLAAGCGSGCTEAT